MAFKNGDITTSYVVWSSFVSVSSSFLCMMRSKKYAYSMPSCYVDGDFTKFVVYHEWTICSYIWLMYVQYWIGWSSYDRWRIIISPLPTYIVYYSMALTLFFSVNRLSNWKYQTTTTLFEHSPFSLYLLCTNLHLMVGLMIVVK